MWYWADPIFQHYNDTNRYKLFVEPIKHTRAISNGAKIMPLWADALQVDLLPKLVRDQTVLLTSAIYHNPQHYAANIHTVNPSYYGILYCAYKVNASTEPTKNFNCFINRYDIFRQSWFYQLIRRRYLDQGHVSFHSEVGPGRIPNSSFVNKTPKEAFNHGFKNYNQIFAAEHEVIKDRIPFCSFKDNGDLTPWVMQSKYSLILETWFHENSVTTFSEKIFRCLQLPRPWILFSSQYAVSQLRSWGFDVLDDIVDHSYDTIADPTQRQTVILDYMHGMMNFELTPHLDRCINASRHNQQILQSWFENWAVNIDADIKAAVEKARNL